VCPDIKHPASRQKLNGPNSYGRRLIWIAGLLGWVGGSPNRCLFPLFPTLAPAGGRGFFFAGDPASPIWSPPSSSRRADRRHRRKSPARLRSGGQRPTRPCHTTWILSSTPSCKWGSEAITYFAHAMGSARSGDLAAADQELEKLKKIRALLEAANQST
jgi:hypothetical protein